jgi:hypothetical protein
MVDFRKLEQPLNIYMAGTLAHNPVTDWRYELVNVDRSRFSKPDLLKADPTNEDMWPVQKKAIKWQHHYTGPYYPSSKGLLETEEASLRASALLRADLIFSHLTELDPTALFEIGFAVGSAIPTIVNMAPSLAEHFTPDLRNPTRPWIILNGVDRYYLKSRPYDALTLAIDIAKELLQENPNVRWAYLKNNKYGTSCYYCNQNTEKGVPFMWKKVDVVSYTAHIECFVKRAPAKVVEASAKLEMLDTLVEVLRGEDGI